MKGVVGVLLAAGASRRFGEQKLLHPLDNGEPIGITAARTLIEVVPYSVAVVRQGDDLLAEALGALGLMVVENPVADSGIGSSLSAGVRAAAGADGWLVSLADMPWIRPATLRALVSSLRSGASIVAPVCAGRRGHPVGFDKRWRDALLAMNGDEGARRLIIENDDQLTLQMTQDSGVIRDIDQPSDLELHTLLPI